MLMHKVLLAEGHVGEPAFIIPLSDSAEWHCDIHGFPIKISQGYKYESIGILFARLHMCEYP